MWLFGKGPTPDTVCVYIARVDRTYALSLEDIRGYCLAQYSTDDPEWTIEMIQDEIERVYLGDLSSWYLLGAFLEKCYKRSPDRKDYAQ
jgi:hypothetical protein